MLQGGAKKKTQYGALEVQEIKSVELPSSVHHTVTIDHPGGAPATTIEDARAAVLGDPNAKSAQLLTNASVREKEEAEFRKMIEGASAGAPPGIVPYIQKITPCLSWTAVCCEATLPIYVRVAWLIGTFISHLPAEEISMLAGLVLCFFGGMYPLTLAAAEALRQCGGAETWAAIHDLTAQFNTAVAALEADEAKDDAEGAGGDEAPKDLLARKARLVLSSTDPNLLDQSFKGVYSSWAAVIAVLKVRFAQTVALGAAIGDNLGKWATIPATKILVHLVAEDLHKWIPNIIFYTCKVIAIVIAYKIQQIISAFYSAIRGGLLVTRNAMTWLSNKKIISIDPDATNIDEYCGWALAALGFYFQFTKGFSAPWFMQLLLWPLGVLEGSLLWAVNDAAPANATPQ